jgi:hypothetical protein
MQDRWNEGGRGREGDTPLPFQILLKYKQNLLNEMSFYFCLPSPLPFLDLPTALCTYVQAVYCECPCFPDV